MIDSLRRTKPILRFRERLNVEAIIKLPWGSICDSPQDAQTIIPSQGRSLAFRSLCDSSDRSPASTTTLAALSLQRRGGHAPLPSATGQRVSYPAAANIQQTCSLVPSPNDLQPPIQYHQFWPSEPLVRTLLGTLLLRHANNNRTAVGPSLVSVRRRPIAGEPQSPVTRRSA